MFKNIFISFFLCLVLVSKAQEISFDLKYKKIERLADDKILVYGLDFGDSTQFKAYILNKNLEVLYKNQLMLFSEYNTVSFEKIDEGNFYFFFTGIGVLKSYNGYTRVCYSEKLDFLYKKSFTSEEVTAWRNANEKKYIVTGIAKYLHAQPLIKNDYKRIHNQFFKEGKSEVLTSHGIVMYDEGDFYNGDLQSSYVCLRNKIRDEGNFEVYLELDRIYFDSCQVFDVYHPDTSSFIYAVTGRNEFKKNGLSRVTLSKVNAISGKIEYKEIIDNLPCCITDFKFYKIDSTIYLTANTATPSTFDRRVYHDFFIMTFDAFTGKLKTKKSIKYNELIKSTEILKENIFIEIYPVKTKADTVQFLGAVLNEFLLQPLDKNGQPTGFRNSHYFDYSLLGFFLLDVDRGLNFLNYREVERIKGKKEILKSSAFTNSYTAPNGNALFISTLKGNAEDDTKGHLIDAVKVNNNQLSYLTIPIDNEFINNNSLVKCEYLARDLESVFEVGFNKKKIFIKIRKI